MVEVAFLALTEGTDIHQVNLTALRRFHAPNWMKTVTTSLNDHGSWSSRIVVRAAQHGFPAPGEGRPLGRTYDPEIIKLWHAKCVANHSTSCHPESNNGITPFPAKLKLIDVERWCIESVAPGQEPEYVALSYVWGNVKQPRLSANLVEFLSIPGALRRHVVLPRTIKDAILPERKHESLRSESAKSAPTHLRWCKIGDISVMEALEDPESWLRDSTWRKRGWTFQEELFSNRVVYFLRTNLLFKCGKATWRADIALEYLQSTGSETLPAYNDHYRHSVRSLMRQPHSTDRREAIDIFRKLVHAYMIRKLTREDDIERAFLGIANALRESIGPLYCGIPEKIFGEVIEGCWSWDLLLPRRDGFPSWSWVGWMRHIAIEPEPEPVLYIGPGPIREVSSIKYPEIGISAARPSKRDRRPLLRFFRFTQGSVARPEPLFAADSTREVPESGPVSFLYNHFVPDPDEIQQRHQKMLAEMPGRMMKPFLVFFTSLAFLSIKPTNYRFQGEEMSFTVHQPQLAKDTTRLTTIRLRRELYKRREEVICPFIVALENDGGFQLMMV
ncbi:hypothetical protein QBC47DRAFT_432236 [Echria macrotheca]|uniref:Heterokaryon incompatibility domain-containing protein n=1 Tax=Echria macrotheca TaxID=438768 RepID=A0AAJ0BB11_9PEZI|nr:hypothetical protein QBC47DRAFT_432236 [Echria macrotheca]